MIEYVRTRFEMGEAFENMASNLKTEEKKIISRAWHDGNIIGRNGWIREEYETGEQYYEKTYGHERNVGGK
jgi:hypothetical protein